MLRRVAIGWNGGSQQSHADILRFEVYDKDDGEVAVGWVKVVCRVMCFGPSSQRCPASVVAGYETSSLGAKGQQAQPH